MNIKNTITIRRAGWVFILCAVLIALAAAVGGQDAPVCAHCGKAISGKYFLSDGKYYHADCYEKHVALRCALCGDIVEGDYLIDSWGNRVCKKHKNDPRCPYCNRFISEKLSEGSRTYKDGRTICGICAKEAVFSVDDARALMRQLADTLALFGIEIDVKEVPLSLVSQTQLNKLATDLPHTDANGLTTYEQTEYPDGRIVAKECKIHVLEGMPKASLIEVLAHEMMHVWLYWNGPFDRSKISHPEPVEGRTAEMDTLLCEGSCNYAAFLVLSTFDSEHIAHSISRLFEDEDPVYGEGCRRVRLYVDKVGIPAWLEYLKKHEKPPW